MLPDYRARLGRLGALLARDELNGLLISDLANIRYLTGFAGCWARLAVGPTAQVLVVDRRYGEDATRPSGVVAVCVEGVRQVDAVAAAVRKAGGKRMGFEPGNLSWWEQRALAERLRPRARLAAAGGHVEALRAIKDDWEIGHIERAARITDRAIKEAFAGAAPGCREIDVAADLAAALRRLGDGGEPAFEPLVASGPGTARIHAPPGIRRLERGDLLLIDAGASSGGMAADCCRTSVVGAEPDARQARAIALVREALDAAIAAVRPGRPAREVALAAERCLARAGHPLPHDLGHGVGLEVHEAPRIAVDSDAVLARGMVLALEPGLYVPGWGGIRLEDVVEVAATGARVLTTAPRVGAC